MSTHKETDRCGFDRNASHSADQYVCTCGWTDDAGAEHDAGNGTARSLHEGRASKQSNERPGRE